MYETYYDSAESLQIDRARAMRELKKHGISDAQSIADFDSELGPVGPYDAQAVLSWLGY